MITDIEWEGRHGDWVWTTGRSDGRRLWCSWCKERVRVGVEIVVGRRAGFGPMFTVHEQPCWRPWHASYILGEDYVTAVVLVRLGGDEGPSLEEVLDEHPDVVLYGMTQSGIGPEVMDIADLCGIKVEGVIAR